MTTATQIITSALRTVGKQDSGASVPAEDIQLGLDRLNDLLDSWATETLYAYTTSEYVYTLPSGTKSITIGPTGNIVAATPTRIEGGFIRSGGVDYSFRVVSYAVYSDIAQKSLGGNYPSVAYYDGNGTLTFYPVPSGGELHVPVLVRLAEFANLTTGYTLPPGYRKALQLSLAEDLSSDFGLPLPPSVIKASAAARRTIKRANHKVPRLNVPYFSGHDNGNVLVTPPDADIYGGGNSGSI